MLFSAWQPITHLPQPLHLLRSIAIAQRAFGYSCAGHAEGPPSCCSVPGLRVLLVGRERRGGHERPAVAVDDVRALREGERLAAVDSPDRDRQARASTGRPPRRRAAGRRWADAVADGAAGRAAEAERQRDLVVVHAGVAVGRRHRASRGRRRPRRGRRSRAPSRRSGAARSRRAPPQVMRVTGSGSSWSQPLLPARPSREREVRVQLQLEAASASARRRRPEEREAAGAQAPRRGRRRGRAPATSPSRRTSFHAVSKAGVAGIERRGARPTPRAGSATRGSGSAGVRRCDAAGAGVVAVAAVTAATAAGSPSAARPVDEHVEQAARVEQRLDDRLLDGEDAASAARRRSSTRTGGWPARGRRRARWSRRADR